MVDNAAAGNIAQVMLSVGAVAMAAVPDIICITGITGSAASAASMQKNATTMHNTSYIKTGAQLIRFCL